MDEILGLFTDPDGLIDETEIKKDTKSSNSKDSEVLKEIPVKKEVPAEVTNQKSADTDTESSKDQNHESKSSRDEL